MKTKLFDELVKLAEMLAPLDLLRLLDFARALVRNRKPS